MSEYITCNVLVMFGLVIWVDSTGLCMDTSQKNTAIITGSYPVMPYTRLLSLWRFQMLTHDWIRLAIHPDSVKN